MFRSLYQKLALVLLLVLLVVGGVGVASTLLTTRLHLNEVDQKLNRDLAANLVAENNLFQDGSLVRDHLEHIFHMLMVINPRIEVYLLDPDGKILAYHAPHSRVRRDSVDLVPIEAFLSQERLPLLGDDPRDPRGRKVFSAAPIRTPGDESPGALQGYLYVVLAGEDYDSVVDLLSSSYILRLSAWTVAAATLVALFLGLTLFRLLTRRLGGLDTKMSRFAESGFSERSAGILAPVGTGSAGSLKRLSRDEIDRVDATFHVMANRIVDQLEELKEADHLRRQLVANVSHDLRTPVAALQGYLETLLLKEGSVGAAEQRGYLQIALRQSECLSNLVAELFELATLDAGHKALERESFSIAELAQDVAQKFQPAADRRSITLRTGLGTPIPPVSGDIRLIERVLDNLIENAISHTDAGGRVEVAVSAEGERVRVQVADTGCGIPKAEVPRIFDRFYRGRQEEPEQGKGAGLGLAIAQRVVELHNSHIDVRTSVGVGTTFSFELHSNPA